jgi:Protein of unknown function (DUF2946)
MRHRDSQVSSRHGPIRRDACSPIALLVLAGLIFRSLIPLGFMPASNGSLSLTLCDGGFSSPSLSHRTSAPEGRGKPSHQSGAHDDHCLFCSSSTPAPAPVATFLANRVFLAISVAVVVTPSVEEVRLVRIPQARAPPALV